MANEKETRYVELTRVSDPTQAEMLAVFLDNSAVEFRMLGRRSAPVLASMTPAARQPVVFEVAERHLDRARELLAEYQNLQAREVVPSEFPEPHVPEKDAPGEPQNAANDDDE